MIRSVDRAHCTRGTLCTLCTHTHILPHLQPRSRPPPHLCPSPLASCTFSCGPSAVQGSAAPRPRRPAEARVPTRQQPTNATRRDFATTSAFPLLLSKLAIMHMYMYLWRCRGISTRDVTGRDNARESLGGIALPLLGPRGPGCDILRDRVDRRVSSLGASPVICFIYCIMTEAKRSALYSCSCLRHIII